MENISITSPSQVNENSAVTASQDMFAYDGDTGKIYQIWIVNLGLKIITLFIYNSWAKTRMRRYVYSRFSLKGEAFHYSGTGGEIFKGSMKVFGLLFGFFLLVGVFEAVGTGMASGMPSAELIYTGLALFTTLLTYIAIFFLMPFGEYSGKRYRLARTKWRGIRGALTGSASSYARTSMKYMLINIFTLFLKKPKYDTLLRKKLVGDLQFGQQKCEFNEDAASLYRIHYITLALFIPTLGISRLWYRAELKNLYLNHMRAGAVGFKGTQTGGALFRLVFGNILLAITMIGAPYALQRYVRYFAKHTHVMGDIESLDLKQAADRATATGDVLGEEYDVGVEFDMGLI